MRITEEEFQELLGRRLLKKKLPKKKLPKKKLPKKNKYNNKKNSSWHICFCAYIYNFNNPFGKSILWLGLSFWNNYRCQ